MQLALKLASSERSRRRRAQSEYRDNIMKLVEQDKLPQLFELLGRIGVGSWRWIERTDEKRACQGESTH